MPLQQTIFVLWREMSWERKLRFRLFLQRDFCYCYYYYLFGVGLYVYIFFWSFFLSFSLLLFFFHSSLIALPFVYKDNNFTYLINIILRDRKKMIQLKWRR